jgi:hypothetical protein
MVERGGGREGEVYGLGRLSHDVITIELHTYRR